MKKYYNELTLLKGIGIILVILGHSFSFTGFDLLSNNFNKYIHNIIYSFHMPLFFFISGLLSYSLKKYSIKVFYLSKIKRLLVPYIFINLIDIIPRHLFNNLVNNKSNSLERVILYSGATTWFIYTMFVLFLIFPIFDKYFFKKDKYYLVGVILFLVNYFKLGTEIELFTINKLIYMSFYFYIGYMLRKYYDDFRKSLRNNNFYIGVGIIFFIIAWQYKINIISKILFPFIGIYFTLVTCTKIKTENKLYKFLFFCGENSLTFYLLEAFCGTIYRVLLTKIIPIQYNFLLISTFFILKITTLFIISKWIINKSNVLKFLLGKY